MELQNLLKNISVIFKNCNSSIDIKGIVSDSRLVREGYCFVAVKGVHTDGHRFIKDAVHRGAVVVVCEEKVNNGVSYVQVKDSHKSLISILKTFYFNPSESLRVIGVTGTNGKTTTTYLLESVLKTQGFSVGVIGTISYRFKGRSIPATNTTPGPVELQALLASIRDQDCKYCCMEVSSHSLDQGRVDGINFRCAVFTNLTPEHLDYHKDMNSYLDAESKLFEMLSNNSYAVLNIDDNSFNILSQRTKVSIMTYGFGNNAQIYPVDIKILKSGMYGSINTPVGLLRIESNIIGRYNVYNIMGCIGAAICEGVKKENIEEGIKALKGIPGRMEPVENNKGIMIYVDYAHTDDALKNVLQTLKDIKKDGRIIVVFGAGGDRDKTKRPKMGKTAGEGADYVIITSDNPRTENALDICKDIEAGLNHSVDYNIIVDRKEAIRTAIQNAKQGDIVLIAGKGHETYQTLKDTVVPFDDREEAGNIVNK
ncbi:UDP-N-acetylmuramoyl-L-alanyl-D-glutamate--2,6-diaminopimelate ligase [bacterium Unc6]|nr:UDP-N-acetylmuramoyl-L-alanyl-D-glutamate--2,6-diaminopimelate ligase [bacterium Unc6]